MTTRWRKLLADLRAMPGRVTLVVLALALGLFGAGTVLTASVVLRRDIAANYRSTHPASAQLELEGGVDAALVREVSRRPDLRAAEAASTLSVRARAADGRRFPLLLFVVPDFEGLALNRFAPDTGAWPPAPGTLLLERQALALLGTSAGDRLAVDTADGGRRDLVVSGTVHDPGLAPARQEQTAYGYVTPATVRALGEDATLHLLKIEVRDRPDDAAHVEAVATRLAAWLAARGHAVEQIRVPPPGRHPHQNQMNAVLLVFLIFAGLAFALSGVLAASVVSALLARQVREIGVMKAVGASTGQIAGLYVAFVAALGALSTAVAVPLARAAGLGFASLVAGQLNFDLTSTTVPAGVILVLLGAGVAVPVLLALFPILAATRTTVLEALNSAGDVRAVRPGVLGRWSSTWRGADRTLLLSVRNALRRPARLLLTVALLASAGAVFLTALNVRAAWEANLDDARRDRRDLLDVRFRRFEDEREVLDVIRTTPGVTTAEPWSEAASSRGRADGPSVVRTYPDGGHGALNLRSAPADGRLAAWTMLQGRALRLGDTRGVLLNHAAKAAFFPDVRVGETVTVSVEGRSASLTVIGVARELLSPAAAYVPPGTFTALTQRPGRVNAVRVAVLPRHSERAARLLEARLERGGMAVDRVVTEETFDEAASGHVSVLIVALMGLAAVMGAVGVLGLASAMGSNVMERTREFAVIRAVGGTSAVVARLVTLEGVFVAVLSVGVAVPSSLPLSLAVGSLVGTAAFRWPLPLVVSPAGVSSWFALAVGFAALASLLPALQAARSTVREALSSL